MQQSRIRLGDFLDIFRRNATGTHRIELVGTCADQRLATLGMGRRYGTKNPLAFMDLQDVQELTNFFERRASAYQVGVSGEVVFDAAF